MYAGMMRAGISMSEADATDLGMYLRIMGHVARQQEDGKSAAPAGEKSGSGQKQTIYLKRGTIDEIM